MNTIYVHSLRIAFDVSSRFALSSRQRAGRVFTLPAAALVSKVGTLHHVTVARNPTRQARSVRTWPRYTPREGIARQGPNLALPMAHVTGRAAGPGHATTRRPKAIGRGIFRGSHGEG